MFYLGFFVGWVIGIFSTVMLVYLVRREMEQVADGERVCGKENPVKWAANNREKARKFSRNYYWAHKEERNAASKKWRDEHKEIYNARMRAYRKKQKAQKQAQNP